MSVELRTVMLPDFDCSVTMIFQVLFTPMTHEVVFVLFQLTGSFVAVIMPVRLLRYYRRKTIQFLARSKIVRG